MALESLRQSVNAEIEVRDGIVLEYIDSGHSIADTAQELHISKVRVHQIIARRG